MAKFLGDMKFLHYTPARYIEHAQLDSVTIIVLICDPSTMKILTIVPADLEGARGWLPELRSCSPKIRLYAIVRELVETWTQIDSKGFKICWESPICAGSRIFVRAYLKETPTKLELSKKLQGKHHARKGVWLGGKLKDVEHRWIPTKAEEEEGMGTAGDEDVQEAVQMALKDMGYVGPLKRGRSNSEPMAVASTRLVTRGHRNSA